MNYSTGVRLPISERFKRALAPTLFAVVAAATAALLYQNYTFWWLDVAWILTVAVVAIVWRVDVAWALAVLVPLLSIIVLCCTDLWIRV